MYRYTPEEIRHFAYGYDKEKKGSLQDVQFALARIAHLSNVDLQNTQAFQNFVQTNPVAKDIVKNALARFGPVQVRGNARSGVSVTNVMQQLLNSSVARTRPDLYQLDSAQYQKDQAQRQAYRTAQQYKREMGDRVAAETSELRKSLASQLAEARGAVKAQENARGMLFSGRRQKREGELANAASSTFAQGAGDIARGARQTSEGLFSRADQIKSGTLGADDAANDIADRARQARESASQSLMNQYSSILGQGIGYWAGDRDKKSTPSSSGTSSGGNSAIAPVNQSRSVMYGG